MGVWLAFECVVLAVVVGIGAAVSPHFLTRVAFEGMLPSFLILGLMAPAMVMIVASGGMDLSVGAVAALVGVVTAALEPTVGLGVALAVGLAAALAVGVVNAVLVGLARVHGAIATLGMMAALRGLARLLSDGRQISVEESPLLALLESQWPFWIVLGVVALGCAVLVHCTPFGRRPAPGAAEQQEGTLARAVFVGGPYVLSSLLAGLAGAVFLSRFRMGSPTTAVGWELEVLLAVILGGTCLGGRCGSVLGALIGVVIVALLHLLLTLAGASEAWARLAVGAGLVLFVLLGRLHYFVVGRLYRSSRAGGS